MKGKHRILYVSPVAQRGGAETVLLHILKYQDRDRFEPITCFLRGGPMVHEAARLGACPFVVPTSRFRNVPTTLRALLSLRSVIKERHIDLVFGNMAIGHLYGGLAALGTSARVVWFQHTVAERPGLGDWLADRIPAAAVLVNSFATLATQDAPGAWFPPVLVRPGVDLSRFDAARLARGGFRRQLGISDRSLLAAKISHFWPAKGHETLLRAMAIVTAHCRDVRLILVGRNPPGRDRDYVGAVRATVAQLGLQDHVFFTGERDDVAEILRDVDLLVHAAESPEGFGLAIAEAMAMKVPVVATRVGAVEEVVGPNECGLLVPPGDATALAQSMLELLRDPPRRAALGEAGRRRVEERFSAQQMVREIEATFERVTAHDGY